MAIKFPGSHPTQLTVTAEFTSKYADNDGNSWSYTVCPWDDEYSELVVRLAILRAGEMWERKGLYAELSDNMSRAIVDNRSGVCADGPIRDIQLAAYPEAL